MAQITLHNPWLQAAHSDYGVQACRSERWREHDIIFIRSNPAFDRFQTSKANWLMIKR